MITGIKKKNKLTEIWFDETGSAVNIRTYNTELKNRPAAYAAKYPAHGRLTDDDECGCQTRRDRPPTILRLADRSLFRGQAKQSQGDDDRR